MSGKALTPEPRAFAEYPQSAQDRAIHRRAMLGVYFATLSKDGFTKTDAERLACREWFRLRKETLDRRSVRRWAAIVTLAGGIDLAPITAFLDAKSCPHPRARRGSKLAGIQIGAKAGRVCQTSRSESRDVKLRAAKSQSENALLETMRSLFAGCEGIESLSPKAAISLKAACFDALAKVTREGSRK